MRNCKSPLLLLIIVRKEKDWKSQVENKEEEIRNLTEKIENLFMGTSEKDQEFKQIQDIFYEKLRKKDEEIHSLKGKVVTLEKNLSELTENCNNLIKKIENIHKEKEMFENKIVEITRKFKRNNYRIRLFKGETYKFREKPGN